MLAGSRVVSGEVFAVAAADEAVAAELANASAAGTPGAGLLAGAVPLDGSVEAAAALVAAAEFASVLARLAGGGWPLGQLATELGSEMASGYGAACHCTPGAPHDRSATGGVWEPGSLRNSVAPAMPAASTPMAARVLVALTLMNTHAGIAATAGLPAASAAHTSDVCCLPWAAGRARTACAEPDHLSLSSLVSLAEKPLLGSGPRFFGATVPVVAVGQVALASKRPADTVLAGFGHRAWPRRQVAGAAVTGVSGAAWGATFGVETPWPAWRHTFADSPHLLASWRLWPAAARWRRRNGRCQPIVGFDNTRVDDPDECCACWLLSAWTPEAAAAGRRTPTRRGPLLEKHG